MAQIEVDFDVYKALTSRRISENVTYNEVIRELLGLDATVVKVSEKNDGNGKGFRGVVYKGVEFPDGTHFRATYKGKTYTGEIKNGVWIDAKGKPQSSPSQAASNITGSGINGWWFWECSRPSDPTWIMIGNLR